MRLFDDSVGFLYLLAILGLALYGLNSLVNTFLYLRLRTHAKQKKQARNLKEWPDVTIQLPIFNEKYTIERLLHAVARLEYPSGHLQIQVLDDSTDDTSSLVSQLVDQYKVQGINIELIHRTNRRGYKAGAGRPVGVEPKTPITTLLKEWLAAMAYCSSSQTHR